MAEGVWVLVVEHYQGTRISAHHTHEGAEQELIDYIHESWGPDDFPDEEMPEDPQLLKEVYFALTDYRESYVLEYVTIDK
jgi:hypothetical protein